MSESIRRFVYLLGPTGVGKTQLSQQIAKQFHWPIINCDSVQAYGQINIGSAKPSKQERLDPPHFLFDYVEPPQRLTVARYICDVLSCLKKQDFKEALFVGGSGFYVQALEKGLYPGSKTPEKTKTKVSEWIKTQGICSLYEWLKEKDPDFAKTVSHKDHYRVRRAVEVMQSQEKTITQLKCEMAKKKRGPLPLHHSLKLGLRMDKQSLKERVVKRTDQMLADGWIEEVASLMDKGLVHWHPLESVGYREVRDFLKSKQQSQEELRLKIITSTMGLIKKQMTWFQRDQEILWFSPDEKERLFCQLRDWLKRH